MINLSVCDRQADAHMLRTPTLFIRDVTHRLHCTPAPPRHSFITSIVRAGISTRSAETQHFESSRCMPVSPDTAD
jgi:hypothetical protein